LHKGSLPENIALACLLLSLTYFQGH
jgi:hypothetical protein